MVSRVRSLILSIAFIILTTGAAFAEQTYCLKQGSRIKAVISKDHLNRIWFSGKSIIEVIGDSTKYKILQDAVSKNLFITPLAAIGEDIEMSVIDAGGRTIDLSLRVAGSKGQIIFIEEKKSCQSSPNTDNQVKIQGLSRTKPINFLSKFHLVFYNQKSFVACYLKSQQLCQDIFV